MSFFGTTYLPYAISPIKIEYHNIKYIKKAFLLFPPFSDMSKVSDFYVILCKTNVLRLHTDNDFSDIVNNKIK